MAKVNDRSARKRAARTIMIYLLVVTAFVAPSPNHRCLSVRKKENLMKALKAYFV